MPVLATRYVRDANTRRLVMRDCDHEWTHLADVEGAVRATGDSLLNYRHSPFYGTTSVALLLRDPISLFNRYMLVLLYGRNLVEETDKQQTKSEFHFMNASLKEFLLQCLPCAFTHVYYACNSLAPACTCSLRATSSNESSGSRTDAALLHQLATTILSF